MHQELSPNGAITLSEVQGTEQNCYFEHETRKEGEYVVQVGSYTYSLSGVGRLQDELEMLEEASTPTCKQASLYLPLENTLEDEWQEIDDPDLQALKSLKFGRRSYGCVECDQPDFNEDDGVVFIEYVWCHESCLPELIRSLDSVWDYTDEMLEEYL